MQNNWNLSKVENYSIAQDIEYIFRIKIVEIVSHHQTISCKMLHMMPSGHFLDQNKKCKSLS